MSALLTALWDVPFVMALVGPAQFLLGHHRMH